MRQQYTAIDLFSGCGGLSLGLERAGFTVKAAVEIDSLAAKTYRDNHPNAIVIEKDIKKVTGRDLRKTAKIGRKTLDLLTGCPPCQGFSRIKNKNKPAGADPLNRLILQFLRIAKELRPRLILLENVPALAKDHRFKKMLRELRALNYYCDWSVLNASDFGVPQRRKRLIMMASRLGHVGLPRKKKVIVKTVRDYIGNLEHPDRTRDSLQKMYLKNTDRIRQLIRRIPRNGGSRLELGKRYQLPCHQRLQGFKDVYGRMPWDTVSPTLTGGCFNPSKGRFLHPRQNRAITMREAALLQTFPKKYKFASERGLTGIARMIGDALPPRFAAAQGRHLIKHLTQHTAH
jgi:DNA (cytosine-5)-methyltransferase 1